MTPKNMACFWYTTVNTLHKSDNKQQQQQHNNNNNNNDSMGVGEVILL
jgi:hypothetical protein